MTKEEEFGLVMFRYDNREIDFDDVYTWIENEIRQLEEENKKLKFMIDNKLGWEDMTNDIKYPSGD